MYPILRQRNFALLWVGGLVSSFGDWLLALALPFYLYQQTQSALASGALFMVNILPRVLFGSVAGVFADRWDRRRTMFVADLLRAGFLLLLLPATLADDWLWLAYPIVALEATLSTFFLPAKGALLPHLVAEQELLAANSLDTVGDSVIRLLAPAIGGALFGFFGLAGVLLIDIASYLFSGLMVRLIQVSSALTPTSATTHAVSQWKMFWSDWLTGLRYVGRDRFLLAIFLVQGIAGVASGILSPLLPVFIQEVLRAGADVMGWMITATGVGTLLAGLVLARVGQHWSPIRVAVFGNVLLGCSLFLTFLSQDTWTAIGLSILAGIGLATGVGFQTAVQSSTNDQYRGRILGAFGTSYMLLMLIGGALGSLLADAVGVMLMLYVLSGLYALAGVLGWLLIVSPKPSTTFLVTPPNGEGTSK